MGYPEIPSAVHFTVYNATLPSGAKNPFGSYNHGPIVTFFDGIFYMSWYNSPRDEGLYKKSVYSTSTDGMNWSSPEVLFTNLTIQGEENGPWTILGANSTSPGRLYTQSGSEDAGLHKETIISVMRRVFSNKTLGPQFWLNRSVPIGYEHLNFPTYDKMDNVTRRDAEQYLASAVRTLTEYPDETFMEVGVDDKSEMKFVILVCQRCSLARLVNNIVSYFFR